MIACLAGADALASHVDVDVGSFERDLSGFRLEDRKGIRPDVPGRRLSELWSEQPPVQHLNLHARVVVTRGVGHGRFP